MNSPKPLHEWFISLFDERKNVHGFVKCFECGQPMHEDIYKSNTWCYSHLVEKGKYKSKTQDPENVVIVHPDCHTLFTLRPSKAVNQYAARTAYKEKHEL